jgi:hypothetical protein
MSAISDRIAQLETAALDAAQDLAKIYEELAEVYWGDEQNTPLFYTQFSTVGVLDEIEKMLREKQNIIHAAR